MTTAQQRHALEHLQMRDWKAAHAIVQQDESPIGCWMHGIVHILEGDLANARYWYSRAGRAWPKRPEVDSELEKLRQELT